MFFCDGTGDEGWPNPSIHCTFSLIMYSKRTIWQICDHPCGYYGLHKTHLYGQCFAMSHSIYTYFLTWSFKIETLFCKLGCKQAVCLDLWFTMRILHIQIHAYIPFTRADCLPMIIFRAVTRWFWMGSYTALNVPRQSRKLYATIIHRRSLQLSMRIIEMCPL